MWEEEELPEKAKAFLEQLAALSRIHGIYVEACGCCGGPWLVEVEGGKHIGHGVNWHEGEYGAYVPNR